MSNKLLVLTLACSLTTVSPPPASLSPLTMTSCTFPCPLLLASFLEVLPALTVRLEEVRRGQEVEVTTWLEPTRLPWHWAAKPGEESHTSQGYCAVSV